MIELVPAGEIRPSTYNPRKADEHRLQLVELSLRKLGWLLPIYADANGEILSGHQRHYVATERIGWDTVPVFRTRPMDLAHRKGLNIAFNRGTNDMGRADTPADLRTAILESGVEQLAEALPDCPEGKVFRCAELVDVPAADLLAVNTFAANTYARGMARMFAGEGIVMPVIVGPDLEVINGIGRLAHVAAAGTETVACVKVDASEVAFAKAMLNLLTMDFDIHTRYAKELRYNAFRRSRQRRSRLGRGFVFAVAGEGDIDITNPRHARAWKRVHGTTVLDFGAGHLVETDLLKKVGVDATAFEPFLIPKGHDAVDKALSVATARDLLARVADGTRWTSVFCSSVMQSVPFKSDREQIVTLLSALCYPDTPCYAVLKHVSNPAFGSTMSRGSAVKQHAQLVVFVADWEKNTTLGDVASGNPKAQKFHTEAEAVSLFGAEFAGLATTLGVHNVQIIATKPLRPRWEKLEAAIRFEFDLPYPDGSTMGLAEAALTAFRNRAELLRWYL